jgi:hypothetical protein
MHIKKSNKNNPHHWTAPAEKVLQERPMQKEKHRIHIVIASSLDLEFLPRQQSCLQQRHK